jgi:hypothetical protein
MENYLRLRYLPMAAVFDPKPTNQYAHAQDPFLSDEPLVLDHQAKRKISLARYWRLQGA